jgi:CubicO group peptidase (beta-lactamase class C family)
MTKASFDLDAIVAEGRAQDVATSFDHELQPHPQQRQTAKAAVGLYTTAQDLARFVLAYTGENPVLRPETVQQMISPQPGTGGTWGLGQTLFVANDVGGYVVGHDGGSLPAWGAWMRVHPASGNGMVMIREFDVSEWLYWKQRTYLQSS